MKKASLIFLLALAFIFLGPRVVLRAHAEGFGITPPYVTNDSLTQNSHYEQTITLVRSDAIGDLQAKVTINVPGAGDWISIDKGTQFTIASGTQQMPIVVSVNVPSNAKLGNYTGNIQIVVSPLAGPTPGTVGITIGAQVSVNLHVINQKSANFTVQRVSLTNPEEGHSFWWMNFPGKVVFTMDISNTGNISASPDKVVFTYGAYLTQAVLETETNSNHLASIDPFESKSVVADIPTYLPQGSYKVAYTIYGRDDGDVIGQGNLDMSVLPPGTLTGYVGYGFWGIRTSEKLITLAVILGILVALYGILFLFKYFFGSKKRRRGRKHDQVFAPPPAPPPHY